MKKRGLERGREEKKCVLLREQHVVMSASFSYEPGRETYMGVSLTKVHTTYQKVSRLSM